MLKYNNIYRNSFILTMLRVIDPLMSLAIISAISRILGTETLGAYSFVYSLTGMFGAASQMGLHSLIVREVSYKKHEASSYLSSAILIGLVTSILLATLLNMTKYYFSVTPEISNCFLIMSVNLLPTFIIYTFESIFVAFERMDLIFIEQILTGIIKVIVTLLLILKGYGLIYLISINACTTVFCVGMCCYLFNKKIARIQFKYDLKHTLDLIRISPVFLLTSIVSIVSARIDVIILTKMTDLKQVALYSAAYRVFEMCMIIPQAYYKSSFPRLANLIKSDKGIFIKMSNDVIKHSSYYMIITIPIVYLAAPFVINIIFGDKFAQSIMIMHFLLIGLIPWGGARIFANLLVVNNLQKYDLVASIVATLLNIVLNIILISKYGVLGAAIANTCSLSLFFIIELGYIKYFIKKLAVFSAITYPTILALLAIILYYITKYFAKLSWVLVVIELIIVLTCMTLYLARYRLFKSSIKNM